MSTDSRGHWRCHNLSTKCSHTNIVSSESIWKTFPSHCCGFQNDILLTFKAFQNLRQTDMLSSNQQSHLETCVNTHRGLTWAVPGLHGRDLSHFFLPLHLLSFQQCLLKKSDRDPHTLLCLFLCSTLLTRFLFIPPAQYFFFLFGFCFSLNFASPPLLLSPSSPLTTRLCTLLCLVHIPSFTIILSPPLSPFTLSS